MSIENLLSRLKSECEYPKPLSVNAPLVAEVIAELRRLDAELSEEQRLNGMGAERELALMAKLEAAERENAKLRAELEAIYSTEPVAWEVYVAYVDNGYVVDDLDDPQLIDDMTNHDAVTTPLIPLPVRKS